MCIRDSQKSVCLGAPFLATKNAINSEYSTASPIFYRQTWSIQTHSFLVWKGSELCDLYRVEGVRFLINLQQETHDFGRSAQHEVGQFSERRNKSPNLLLSKKHPTSCWALRRKSWVSCCKLIKNRTPSTLYKSHNLDPFHTKKVCVWVLHF